MNLTALSIRVQQSRLLSEPERMYWIRHIPRMSAEQIATLDRVLEQGEKLRWSEQVPNYMAAKTLLPVS